MPKSSLAKSSEVASKKVSGSKAQAPQAKSAAPAASAPAKPKAAKTQSEPVKAKKNGAPKAAKKQLVWEAVPCQFKAGKQADDGFRAKVPGGWFVSVSRNKGGGAFFYPDAAHQWDGSSL